MKKSFLKRILPSGFFQETGGSVVGVDIGSSSIKVVQLRQESSIAVLETYGEIALGPYANIEIGRATSLSVTKKAEALVDVMREAEITAPSAAFSIPFAASLVTLIDLPKVSDRELTKMVPLEARKYIPVPIGEVMLDWFVIPQNDQDPRTKEDSVEPKKSNPLGKRRVLLAAIHKEVLQDHTSVIEKANLVNDFFEIEIFSAIRATLGQNLKPSMLIDVGAATTKIYIVEYGIVRTSHLVNRGSQDVTIGISKALNMSMLHAEELKRKQGLGRPPEGQDIEKVALLTLDYTFSEANRVLLNYQKKYGKNVGEVTLSGGGALMKGIKELAERHLQTSVKLGDPFSRVETPAFLEQALKEAGPSFVVAIGLALRKLGEQN